MQCESPPCTCTSDYMTHSERPYSVKRRAWSGCEWNRIALPDFFNLNDGQLLENFELRCRKKLMNGPELCHHQAFGVSFFLQFIGIPFQDGLRNGIFVFRNIQKFQHGNSEAVIKI